MNKVKQALKEAWKLIEEPAKRCVGFLAMDSHGRTVSPHDNNAVCFCSFGALMRATGKDLSTYGEACFILDKAAKDIGFSEGTIANDFDVINNPPLMYARAIELASAEEK